MSRALSVVVVGGGVTGLAMAARLAQSPQARWLDVTVLDAAPRPVFDPDAGVQLRVSAIAHASAELLDEIGAWSTVLATRACAYEHMRVWDAGDVPESRSTLRFDADQYGVPELGHIVENELIRHSILEVLDERKVELRFDSAIQSLQAEAGRYGIILDDGTRLDADLTIAADGASSPVRELAGISIERVAYGQTAFVTHMQPEQPHQHTAWQRFLDTGPLALLPLDDGRVSIVWSTTPELAQHAIEASDEDLSTMLTTSSDRVLGKLSPAGPRGCFPLAAQHAGQYVLPGLALIGDAAHSVHPLAGQGANLGFADVQALGYVIDAALARGEYPADRPVLRRYEQQRRGANATMMHFLTGLNRLFASNSVAVGAVRRAGMRAFNASGVIRDHAIGVALGTNRR